MSENAKIWADGVSIKSRELEFGTILNVGVNVDKFVAFLNKNKNEKGYVNLNILKRKDVGQFGDTHNCSLDTWKPKTQAGQVAAAPQAKQAVKKAAPAPVSPPDDENMF